MRRPLIAVALAAALVAGCGDDEAIRETSNPLDAVEVTGEGTEQPTLEFDAPLEVTETTRSVIEEGEGEVIKPGSSVTLHFLFVNGRDGEQIDTSFDKKPATLVMDDQLMAGIYEGLNGVPAGSHVLVGIAPTDGLGEDPSRGVLETDTLLFYAEILDPLSRAEGEAVEPVAGLPTVELAEDGTPTITVPDADPPAELIVQPLIEGSGPVVEAGQTITVHYTGVTWDTGEVFDSSWERGSPASFPIGTGGVIDGWDEGLVGQTVGSQILLVVPPDKGYGDTGSGETIPPGATLVFVVDILAAS